MRYLLFLCSNLKGVLCYSKALYFYENEVNE
nr:MAG TPA: hypothetical protein [Caudoviricetes sp.]DAM39412.1 MAG TPA: hypothetical protein [Caudoviricetes sp.]